MRRLDDPVRNIQLARVPEHAEFRGILRALAQATSHLGRVRLPYLAVVKLALLLKEIEKNCYALRLEAENELNAPSSDEAQNEIALLRITGLASLSPLIDDADKLATQGNNKGTPVVLRSSKHPNLIYSQYGILLKIYTMIEAYIGLLNVLTASTIDRKERLRIALSFLPYERELYYFIAVSRSEYTGS